MIPTASCATKASTSPPLVVLDRENLRRDNGFTLGNVIYLSTFSKTLAPGIRLAWIVAPEDVISKLVQLKQAADLHTSTFNQYVAYEVARDGFLDQHVKLIRQVYRERRDAMLQALHEYFPAGSHLDASQGRLVPVGNDAGRHRLGSPVPSGAGRERGLRPRRQLLRQQRTRRRPPHAPELLPLQPEQIREGIRRLSVAVKMQLHRNHQTIHH